VLANDMAFRPALAALWAAWDQVVVATVRPSDGFFLISGSRVGRAGYQALCATRLRKWHSMSRQEEIVWTPTAASAFESPHAACIMWAWQVKSIQGTHPRGAARDAQAHGEAEPTVDQRRSRLCLGDLRATLPEYKQHRDSLVESSRLTDPPPALSMSR